MAARSDLPAARWSIQDGDKILFISFQMFSSRWRQDLIYQLPGGPIQDGDWNQVPGHNRFLSATCLRVRRAASSPQT
jgi:hypothetical protein